VLVALRDVRVDRQDNASAQVDRDGSRTDGRRHIERRGWLVGRRNQRISIPDTGSVSSPTGSGGGLEDQQGIAW
jgi:hypothetical protein